MFSLVNYSEPTNLVSGATKLVLRDLQVPSLEKGTEEYQLVENVWATRLNHLMIYPDDKRFDRNFCGILIRVNGQILAEKVGGNSTRLHSEPELLIEVINQLLQKKSTLPVALQTIINTLTKKQQTGIDKATGSNENERVWQDIMAYRNMLNAAGVTVIIFTEREPCEQPRIKCKPNLKALLEPASAHKIYYGFGTNAVPDWGFGARILQTYLRRNPVVTQSRNKIKSTEDSYKAVQLAISKGSHNSAMEIELKKQALSTAINRMADEILTQPSGPIFLQAQATSSTPVISPGPLTFTPQSHLFSSSPATTISQPASQESTLITSLQDYQSLSDKDLSRTIEDTESEITRLQSKLAALRQEQHKRQPIPKK